MQQILHAQYGNVLFEEENIHSRRELVERALSSHVHLDWADLRDIDLSGLDMHGAKLSYADLRRSRFWGTKLYNADLTGASLHFADLRDAQFQWASFIDSHCSYADFRGADLSYCNMEQACLRYADLREANLFAARLRYVDLEGANMTGCEWPEKGTDNTAIDNLGCDIDTIDFTPLWLRLIAWLDTFVRSEKFSNERFNALEAVWFAAFNDGMAYAAKHARLCQHFTDNTLIRDLIIGVVRPRTALRPKAYSTLLELQHILKEAHSRLPPQYQQLLDAAAQDGKPPQRRRKKKPT